MVVTEISIEEEIEVIEVIEVAIEQSHARTRIETEATVIIEISSVRENRESMIEIVVANSEVNNEEATRGKEVTSPIEMVAEEVETLSETMVIVSEAVAVIEIETENNVFLEDEPCSMKKQANRPTSRQAANKQASKQAISLSMTIYVSI